MKRTSPYFEFTYHPGNPKDEERLASLRQDVRGTKFRVVLQGRLGPSNPNAHKYSRSAPRPLYKDGKCINRHETGKSGVGTHSRIQKADAAYFDVYVYSKPR